MAQARAKMEMREAITPSDAADVVELMGASLFDAAQDEFG
jgi:DNA replicative helicase MCM subunit Mcm2 (Cdc46/Mcm family)